LKNKQTDKWPLNDPHAMASIRRGFKQSKEGKGVYLGSFAKYAAEKSSPVRINRGLWLKGSNLIRKSIGKPIKITHSKIYEAGLKVLTHGSID